MDPPPPSLRRGRLRMNTNKRQDKPQMTQIDADDFLSEPLPVTLIKLYLRISAVEFFAFYSCPFAACRAVGLAEAGPFVVQVRLIGTQAGNRPWATLGTSGDRE